MPNTRMLLVDDDEAIRSTLSNLLRQQGFHVTAEQRAGGSEAYQF
jgi:CheY-like chemotaxis protein